MNKFDELNISYIVQNEIELIKNICKSIVTPLEKKVKQLEKEIAILKQSISLNNITNSLKIRIRE